MPQKKICFISLFSYSLYDSKSKSRFGGAEVRSYLLASKLSKMTDIDVHVVTFNHGGMAMNMAGDIKLHVSRDQKLDHL